MPPIGNDDRRFSRRQTLQAGLMASAAAGASVLGVTAQEASPAATTPIENITPESVAEAIAKLPGVVDGFMDRTGVPGVAVAVVYEDQVQFAEGYGLREVGVEGDVDADTVFLLASVSKPVASTVVSAIVGDGEITWDSAIADLGSTTVLSDPWVSGRVTLADLFSHRSGLPGHVLDALEDLGGDRDQVLHALRYVDLVGDFRASYAYTNFGLTAAAVTAAEFSGQSWEEASATRLYEPAGMSRTTSLNAEFLAMDNRAVGHVLDGATWVHGVDRQPDAQSPAGGASSSVNDMAQWMRLQLNGGELDGVQIVPTVALNPTHLPQAVSMVPDDPTITPAGFYGLGWNVSYQPSGEVQLSHSGAFALGAATCVYVLPATGLGIIVLTNGAPLGLPEAIALTFLDNCKFGAPRVDFLEVIGPIIEASVVAEYGTDVAEPPLEVRPPAAPEAYLGTYESNIFGPLEVVEDGEHLAMVAGPAGMEFPLAHYSRDVFTFLPPGENGGITSAVTFTLGPDGIAEHVVLENLDLFHAGTFTRPVAENEE